MPVGSEQRHAVRVCAAARPRVACLCHWGGRLLRCGAGVRWAKLDLAWEFGSPGHVGAALRKQPAFLHSCGGAAAAAGGGGKAMRRLTDFDPPGC
jgi:hypothetical protein